MVRKSHYCLELREGPSVMSCSRGEASATRVPVPGSLAKKTLSSREDKDKSKPQWGAACPSPASKSPSRTVSEAQEKLEVGSFAGKCLEGLMLSTPPRKTGHGPALPSQDGGEEQDGR